MAKRKKKKRKGGRKKEDPLPLPTTPQIYVKVEEKGKEFREKGVIEGILYDAVYINPKSIHFLQIRNEAERYAGKELAKCNERERARALFGALCDKNHLAILTAADPKARKPEQVMEERRGSTEECARLFLACLPHFQLNVKKFAMVKIQYSSTTGMEEEVYVCILRIGATTELFDFLTKQHYSAEVPLEFQPLLLLPLKEAAEKVVLLFKAEILERLRLGIEEYNRTVLPSEQRPIPTAITKIDVLSGMKEYQWSYHVEGFRFFKAKGEIEKAIKEGECAISLNAKDYETHFLLGELYLEAKKPDESIAHLSEGLKMKKAYLT